MKIAYNKKQLNQNLILGLIWSSFFFINFFFEKELRLLDYGWIVISLIYFCIYFYQKKYKYIIIENGILKIQGLFRKKIELDKIKRIKVFAGDYILGADGYSLTINTLIVDSNSLSILKKELEQLNVKWI
jgi:hypothetical protein